MNWQLIKMIEILETQIFLERTFGVTWKIDL